MQTCVIISLGRVIHMIIQALEKPFSICSFGQNADIDLSKFSTAFIAHTSEGCSVICPSDEVPQDALARNDGWRAVRIAPPVNRDMMGVLLDLSKIFALAEVSVMPVSTYDTMYFLLRSDGYLRALKNLQENGYKIEITYLQTN